MAVCSVTECARPTDTRGMCQAHYLRWRKYGDPHPERPIRRTMTVAGPCLADGCRNPRIARGYCSPHYQRLLDHGDPLGGGPSHRYKAGGPCAIEGCERVARTSGMCGMHYSRVVRHGDAHHERTIKGVVTRGGYHYTSAPHHPNASKHGWIPTHRIVMSEYLGRALLPGEEVHHRNGDRLDNRIENLELWSTSQPKGQRVSDKLAWARELLATYATVEDRL